MSVFDDFLMLSRYAGSRVDFVQAAGGNVSAQDENGMMYIKASGYYLADVSAQKGFVCIPKEPIKALLAQALRVKEDKRREMGDMAHISLEPYYQGAVRPSIEVFFHVLFSRYTLHTHPLAVSALVCQQDWQGIAKELFPDAILVPYITPGLALAALISEHASGQWRDDKPVVVFLENHGIIISAQTPQEVISMHDMVLARLAAHVGLRQIPYQHADALAKSSSEVDGAQRLGFVCGDSLILQTLKDNPEVFFHKPIFPDAVVFLGAGALLLREADDPVKVMREYYQEYGAVPTVLVTGSLVTVLANNVRKAKEVEDIFKAQLNILLLKSDKPIKALALDEIRRLLAWDAEKYRIKI